MKIYTQKIAPAISEQHFQFDPSFGPYITTLKTKQEQSTDIIAKFYRYLLKKFQQQPHLLVPFKNVKVLELHEDLIELLKMTLLPLSADTEKLPMALAFMQPSCLFCYTDSFKNIFIDQHVEFDTKEDEVGNLRYFIRLVLERCYNIETEGKRSIIKQVKDLTRELSKYYSISIESSFIQVSYEDELPPFEEQWLKMLTLSDEQFLTHFLLFPSNKFKLEGFCMITAEDVSKEVALNKLKNALLNMHTTELEETIQSAGAAIGDLLNDTRIKLGITPFFKINERLVYDSSFLNKAITHESEDANEPLVDVEDIYSKFLTDPTPYIFQNIVRENISTKPHLKYLVEKNIKSFVAYPIITDDGLMGVVEIGFTEKTNISSKITDLLEPAFPLITDLIYHMLEIFDNQIDRLVKEKFTPLQPSVEWKFNEVAWEYLLQQGSNSSNETIGNVIFRQVHPLYGAVDIRDSSIKRNRALKNDFVLQLEATQKLFEKTARQISLPLLDSIQFKCTQYLQSLNDSLTSEDELSISEFLEQEVLIFLQYLSNRYPSFHPEVKSYIKDTDVEKGQFHQNLQDYELSFRKVNRYIERYYEAETERLQSTFPFYFEKFRTDGVEYNIFIGQAIVPDQKFDPIYLKNLRLWQITSMAHIARTNAEMQNNLPVPLETTQLILVHNQPIDISFRKDERRFDVEGVYNIRYEMLKKRIDKVKIKGSAERLTQPHKVAIVYSNTNEVEEYLKHINFLQNKGVLTADIEMVELENLQGVTGLKAIRVGVQC